MKKDNGIIQVKPDSITGTEPKERAKIMARKKGLTLSGYIKWLINRDWKNRNK